MKVTGGVMMLLRKIIVTIIYLLHCQNTIDTITILFKEYFFFQWFPSFLDAWVIPLFDRAGFQWFLSVTWIIMKAKQNYHLSNEMNKFQNLISFDNNKQILYSIFKCFLIPNLVLKHSHTVDKCLLQISFFTWKVL